MITTAVAGEATVSWQEIQLLCSDVLFNVVLAGGKELVRRMMTRWQRPETVTDAGATMEASDERSRGSAQQCRAVSVREIAASVPSARVGCGSWMPGLSWRAAIAQLEIFDLRSGVTQGLMRGANSLCRVAVPHR